MAGYAQIEAAVLGLGLITTLSCCGEKRPADGDVKALMETSRAWSKTVASGNLDKIVSYWTDDAVVMMPGEPVRRGKDQIVPYVRDSLKTPGFSISWEPIEG